MATKASSARQHQTQGVSAVSGTRPLADQLEEIVATWANSQYELVTLAAEFADSPEWIVTGSPTAARWLAIIADVEPCTAREWIRIGRLLKTLPATADAFKTRQISYSKVRTLTRLATPDNEHELLDIATITIAADLGRALAAWLHRNAEAEDIDAHHQRHRSVKWRIEPDATNRRRHPSRRQKRVVKARDQHCADCGRADLLEYDHVPSYQQTGHTITGQLQLRCAPCHHQRHRPRT